MGALSANLSRCSSIWPCCLSQPPSWVSQSLLLLPTLKLRLKLILTICMVDLDIMVIVDLDIMDMVDMLDMVGIMDTLMDMENKAAQQLIIKNNIVTIQITCIQCLTDLYNADLCNLNGHVFAPQSLNTVSVQNMTWQSSPYYDRRVHPSQKYF